MPDSGAPLIGAWRAISCLTPFRSAPPGLLMIAQTDLHNYFVSNHFGPALFAVYSLGTLQLPLMGLIWEATNSVLITRVSVLQKRNEPREIVLLVARAARKLAAVYFPVYVFLMVAGREFIQVLFTARFARELADFRRESYAAAAGHRFAGSFVPGL